MNNSKLIRVFALGLVLMQSAGVWAQSLTSQVKEDEPSAQISLPHTFSATAVPVTRQTLNGVQPALASNSYTAYCAYRFNGSGVIINCSDPRINANSRVFVAMSEYQTNPATDRFIGAARMTVHNVRPYNGGFNAWVDVEWSYPLNVRVDFLCEP